MSNAPEISSSELTIEPINLDILSPAMRSRLENARAQIAIEREMIQFNKYRYAMLKEAGLLPKQIETWQQFAAIVSYGNTLGIDMWVALKHIPVINGNPSPDVQLTMALVYQSGQLKSMSLTDDGTMASCTMVRSDGRTLTCTFSQSEADAAVTSYFDKKLNQRVTKRLSDKDVWQAYPSVMRQWRAVGRCARHLFPDVINGLLPKSEEPIVISEDPVRPWKLEPVTPPQSIRIDTPLGNGGKERRMSDPSQLPVGQTPPQPTPAPEAEISEAEFAKEIVNAAPKLPDEPPASAFTLDSNIRTGETGPAHKLNEPTASDLKAQLDAVSEEQAEQPADPKGYLMDTTLHRSNFHSWAWRTLQMHQDMLALAFDIDPKTEGWKKALDEALAKTSRSDAEEILRAFNASEQAKANQQAALEAAK